MTKKKLTLWTCLAGMTVMLFLAVPAGPVRADLRGPTISTWRFDAGGIWRREVRTRELARWYRHYEWTTIQNLWLKRRAEGVWVYGKALSQFTCRAHCIVQNPRGPGVWRIWVTKTRNDVKRFRKHYRVWWAGHLNNELARNFPNALHNNPLNRRFCIALDHVEVVTTKIPEDPNPLTPFNENVEIMDELGEQHFLGEPGFELQDVPGFQQNPFGFVLATTVQSTQLLPPPAERIQDPDIIPPNGWVEIAPGVVVCWLMDDDGNVLVKDPTGAPLDPLDPAVLGNQKHQGLIGDPTGVENNELPIQSNNPIQLYCWELDENGEVLGAIQGDVIVGPPVDLNGDGAVDPGSAIGGPIAMDPTVRDEHDQLDRTAVPVECVIEEDDEPTTQELADLNGRLLEAGIPPVSGPFKLCIKTIKIKRFWGIDRRVVMDTWIHHWSWRIQQHFRLTRGIHRVWLTKLALAQFNSNHRHYVVGQPPTFHGYSLTHVRFFRVCYRVFCPRPGVIRVKIDQLWVVLPMDPDDPGSPLMMITTENNENALLDPLLLSGQIPDSLAPNGMLVTELSPILDTLDMGGGGTGVFTGDLSPLSAGGMAEIPMVGNFDTEMELNNNQLQLYCWVLDESGVPMVDSFDVDPGQPPVMFTVGPTPAIPLFRDDTVVVGEIGSAEVVTDPTMLGIELSTPFLSDCNGDGIVNLLDLACLGRDWLKSVPII